MSMFQLNNSSHEVIKRYTGLTKDQVDSFTLEEIEKKIEQKIGKPLEYMTTQDARLLGRGNIYMYLGRLLGIKEINDKISKI